MNQKLYDLTNPQKNIWNTEQYFKGNPINNIGGTVHLKIQLDFSVLSRAVSNVISMRDNFHIRIIKQENGVKQFFVPLYDYHVEIVDLADISELKSIEENMCKTIFSIENDNLFCVKIFKLPDGTGGVASVMHHIISDSWTVGLFCKEIVEEYCNLIKNIKSNDVNYSYINFIEKEQQYLNSLSFEKDKKYWSNVFSTIPESATIPGSISNDSHQISCVAKRQSFTVPKNLLDKIFDFCKVNRI